VPTEAIAIAERAIAKSPGPWLFSTKAWARNPAGRYTSHRLLKALRVAMAGAGVKKGRIHSLRHSFCAFAANRNIPAFKVMKILGHGSLKAVLKYYHVSREELLSSLDGVDFINLLNPKGKEAA
jgi:integrase